MMISYTEGDVRFALSPDELAERLTISEYRTTILEESDIYEQDSIIPDMASMRKCTDAELEYYSDTTSADLASRSIVRVVSADPLRIGKFKNSSLLFGVTPCDPNTKTTTVNAATEHRPGMHIDSGKLHRRRLGINFGPGSRRLLAVTHSAQLLFGEETEVNTKMARDRLSEWSVRRGQRPRILHLKIQMNEMYSAHTGNIIHDGSTYGIDRPSTIGFIALSD